jgi:hypothetical protein
MIEFVTVVLFGCYSAQAIDEIIDTSFDLTEMQEQINEGACFYEYTPDIKATSIYKRFLWSDGDKMVVVKGKSPEGDNVYFWVPEKKLEKLQGPKV